MSVPELYEAWATEPNKETMTAIVRELKPLINSEINKYSGSNTVLRTKARALAIKAVKSYDPTAGAKLTSWVTSQMRPLIRYSRYINNPSQTSELAIRQGAEIAAARDELSHDTGIDPTDEQLADYTGLSTKRIGLVRKMTPASVTTGRIEDSSGDSEGGPTLIGLAGDPSEGMYKSLELVRDSLSDRDKSILDYKTGYNGKQRLDNKSIAKRLGVTPSSVTQRSKSIADLILGNQDV